MEKLIQVLGTESMMLEMHIATRSGKLLNLANPDPADIVLEDIAWGLANTCRWNAQPQAYYSVAEHCVRCHDKAMDQGRDRALHLFHDAEEAYFGDIARPVKAYLKANCPEFIEMMTKMRLAIFAKFGLEYSEEYKEIDNQELRWEANNVLLSLHNAMSPIVAYYEWVGRAKTCIEETLPSGF